MALNLSGIDLNLLVILDALLEEKNVTRVSERVGRSQPAVSNSLRRLRALFDDELLVQEGRSMRLTERAHQLKGPLSQALSSVKRTLETKAKFDPSSDQFTIRLFASGYVSVVLLPKLMERLKREAPKADLIVSWGDRNKIGQMLLAETVDVAIGHYHDTLSGVKRAKLFSEKPVVLGRKGHPAFKNGLTVADFVEAPHVSVSYEALRFGYVEQAAAAVEAIYRSEIIISDFLVTPFLTLKSDALAVVGERLARVFCDSMALEYRPIPFSIAPIGIEIIWSPAVEEDAALSWFRDLVCEVAPTL